MTRKENSYSWIHRNLVDKLTTSKRLKSKSKRLSAASLDNDKVMHLSGMQIGDPHSDKYLKEQDRLLKRESEITKRLRKRGVETEYSLLLAATGGAALIGGTSSAINSILKRKNPARHGEDRIKEISDKSVNLREKLLEPNLPTLYKREINHALQINDTQIKVIMQRREDLMKLHKSKERRYSLLLAGAVVGSTSIGSLIGDKIGDKLAYKKRRRVADLETELKVSDSNLKSFAKFKKEMPKGSYDGISENESRVRRHHNFELMKLQGKFSHLKNRTIAK